MFLGCRRPLADETFEHEYSTGKPKKEWGKHPIAEDVKVDLRDLLQWPAPLACHRHQCLDKTVQQAQDTHIHPAEGPREV